MQMVPIDGAPGLYKHVTACRRTPRAQRTPRAARSTCYTTATHKRPASSGGTTFGLSEKQLARPPGTSPGPRPRRRQHARGLADRRQRRAAPRRAARATTGARGALQRAAAPGRGAPAATVSAAPRRCHGGRLNGCVPGRAPPGRRARRSAAHRARRAPARARRCARCAARPLGARSSPRLGTGAAVPAPRRPRRAALFSRARVTQCRATPFNWPPAARARPPRAPCVRAARAKAGQRLGTLLGRPWVRLVAASSSLPLSSS